METHLVMLRLGLQSLSERAHTRHLHTRLALIIYQCRREGRGEQPDGSDEEQGYCCSIGV